MVAGENLFDFLCNLDYLHQHLQETWVNARFPHFKCVLLDNGDLSLIYESTRGSLLAPFVSGLVSAVAEEIFSTPVDISIPEVSERGANLLIRIKGKDEVEDTTTASPSLTDLKAHEAGMQLKESGRQMERVVEDAAKSLETAGLPMSFFLSQWPYFILMDDKLNILAVGPSLTKHAPSVVPGAHFQDLFYVERPKEAREASYDTFLEHSAVSYRVKLASSEDKSLILRGAMHCLNHSNTSQDAVRHCLFLCSAQVLNIGHMLDSRMHMNDFALHDAARDLIFMSESNTAQQKLLMRLECLSEELAHEQARRYIFRQSSTRCVLNYHVL